MNSIAFAFLFTVLANASFEETLIRYPSPYGVLAQLRRLVPTDTNATCQKLGQEIRPVLGAMDPLQGSALEKIPGPFFVGTFSHCLEELLSTANTGQAFSERVLGKKLSKVLIPIKKNWSEIRWESLSASVQSEILDRFIDYIIGPEEILHYYNYIGPKNIFDLPLANKRDFRQFLATKVITEPKPNDVLKGLTKVYYDSAILLRLGPALKH